MLEDDASVGSVRQTSAGVAMVFDGDRDIAYVLGDGVTPENVNIVSVAESDLFLT
jgi:hypothetical protein